MARWGKADFKQLEQLQANLKKLEAADADQFCREAAKELAARLLGLVIPDTPVGSYPPGSGKKGGTLRRGWTAGVRGGAKAYAQSLTVTKRGSLYQIEVMNPVDYASYVEYGHRTPGGGGWVPGRYMLTKAELRLDTLAPAVLQRKLEALLKEAFHV